MNLDLHRDAVTRDETIVRYLRRRLPDAGEFESHYLTCDDCFEELGATRLLIEALSLPAVASSREAGVAVLRFLAPAQLLRDSVELQAVLDAVRLQNESRVLIDLSTVSRIDSAGLGVLMNCYCHARRSSGSVKLLKPNAPVKKVLAITKLDSVLETFDDESAAISSFAEQANS